MNKYITLLLLLTFFSCKKFLDEKPDKSKVIPSTINDFQRLLDDAGIMNTRHTPSYGEASADDYFLTDITYNGLDKQDQQKYTWKPVDVTFSNDWTIAYLAVYTSNLCIEGIEKIEPGGTENKDWNNVKGSALFYRAYNFLNLAWTYSKAYDESTMSSDLGIALRLKSDFNEKSVRSFVGETYERIITDLNEAVLLLPDMPVHPYRPSKAAAYGLLARTYLSMRKYDLALTNVNLALSINSNLQDYNDVTMVTPGATIPFKPFNKEIIFYAESNLSSYLYANYQAEIDTNLVKQYGTDDVRRTAFFNATNGYNRFKGSYSSAALPFTGIAVDELFLIKSECMIRKGEFEAGITTLNTLLEKRFKTGTFKKIVAADQADALVKVLLERRKQLLMRGLRWSDIKRFNKESANLVLRRKVGGQIFELAPNANYYALPLPKDVIDNSDLMQNPQ